MNKKTLLILLLFAMLIEGCNDNDSKFYPVEPKASFKSIVYYNDENHSGDTLALTLSFLDDGDLGIDPSNIDPPFHYINLFVEYGDGSLDTVSVSVIERNGEEINVLNADKYPTGNLVTIRTRNKANYQYLPPLNCKDYIWLHSAIFVPWTSFPVISNEVYYYEEFFDGKLLRDTLLFEINEYLYNLHIDFLIKQDNSFVEFEFPKEYCGHTWNARFPTVTGRFKGKYGPFEMDYTSKHEGTITFNIQEYNAFQYFLKDKTLKLRFYIIDRALHRSNVVETPEFTLESIRKN